MKKGKSLQFKIMSAFLVVALIGTAIGVVGVVNIREINKADTFLYEKCTVSLKDLVYISTNFQKYRAALGYILYNHATKNFNMVNDYLKIIDEMKKTEDEYIDNYKTTYISKEDEVIFLKFLSLYDGYKVGIDRVVDLLNKNRMAEAHNYTFSELVIIRNEAQIVLDEIIRLKITVADKTADDNTELANMSTIVVIATIILGLIVSIILSIWIGVYLVARPVKNIVFNLSAGAEQMSTSSAQLSDAAQEIANGATEQASAIEETTSSMEELSSMVKQNVENAKESSILAEKTTESSNIGVLEMNKMLESMNGISKSTDEIQGIIDIIEDIAFQTNMLALNAAVEAARAGESGMGFAVVADEVKSLANRSSESAKETAKMIKETIRKIESGLEVSKRLSEVFKDIVNNSNKVKEMTREVESASRQQDDGIGQINKAIVQFDVVVQSNASSSEETANAAEELQSQVESLNNVVNELHTLVTGSTFTRADRDSGNRRLKNNTLSQPVPRFSEKTKAIGKTEIVKPDVDLHKISFESDEEFKSF